MGGILIHYKIYAANSVTGCHRLALWGYENSSKEAQRLRSNWDHKNQMYQYISHMTITIDVPDFLASFV